MHFHRLSVVFLFLAVVTAIPLSQEARCEVPRGYFTDVINLGPDVNTIATDTLQVLSAEGLTMYFNSTREGGFGDHDLYQATRPTANDPFGNVMNLASINSSFRDNFPSISYDGLTLYFQSTRPGGEGEFDLWLATRPTANDEFGNVTNLGPDVNSPFIERGPDISVDGLTLYFTSTRPGGEDGSEDMYMATRENLGDPFGNVTRLGTGVNGPAHEFEPSVSSDGLVMFLSDRGNEPFRPGGHGGPDIWIAARESTDQPFGNVVNLNDFSMGSNINSGLWENAPSISRDWPASGSQLHYSVVSENVDGFGSFDIMQATWVPEELGDFDGYGQLDATDLDRLMREIAARTNDVRLDVTDDDLVNGDGLTVWINDLKKTWFGDANLDGQFDSGDFVQVFQAGQYEDNVGQNSTWSTGDWNADLEFNSGDFVVAFQEGGYEQGPRQAFAAVPEPSSLLLLTIGLGHLLTRTFVSKS